MKRLLLLLLLLVQLLHACAPSANVVSNHLIQKRKYYAGWNASQLRLKNNASIEKKNPALIHKNETELLKESFASAEDLPKRNENIVFINKTQQKEIKDTITQKDENTVEKLKNKLPISLKSNVKEKSTEVPKFISKSSRTYTQKLKKKTDDVTPNSDLKTFNVFHWINLFLFSFCMFFIVFIFFNFSTPLIFGLLFLYFITLVSSIIQNVFGKKIPEKEQDETFKQRFNFSKIRIWMLLLLPFVIIILLIYILIRAIIEFH